MPAATYNFTIEQGAYWERVVTWTDPAGNLVNLTGWQARMQLRDSIDAAAVALELTDVAGITLGANGTITIAITAAQTAALLEDSYVYDLLLTPAGGGEPERLIEGVALLSRAVTR